MNSVPWNVDKSGFQKIFENFFSVRVILDMYLWRQGSRFRARAAKGKPAFRDCITRGNIESKMVYRGVSADLEKPKNIFG